MGNFDRNVTGIGALADPVRRHLYEFVCSQAEPVSRDQAAKAVGIARHQAKFHLDRLEAEGLLETDYVRLSGRTGPGAGRPAKRYRRGRKEFTVALPAREYELAGEILADAITDATRTGIPISQAVSEAAAARGTAIAEAANDQSSSADAPVDLVLKLLSEHGYEPRGDGHTFILANCPFHALARSHTELVCQINHTLIAALAESVAPDQLDARLEAADNRCCVTLTVKD
jgi:predicted ArsR family transcriptional regulator